MVEKKLVSKITEQEAEDLFIASPDVQTACCQKLECSLAAVKGGVESVHIINGSTEPAVLLKCYRSWDWNHGRRIHTF